jgi:hypothetical protein
VVVQVRAVTADSTADESVDVHPAVKPPKLGGVVHRAAVDAVHLPELLLDARCAGRARHAFDVQAKALGCRRGHAAS